MIKQDIIWPDRYSVLANLLYLISNISICPTSCPIGRAIDLSKKNKRIIRGSQDCPTSFFPVGGASGVRGRAFSVYMRGKAPGLTPRCYVRGKGKPMENRQISHERSRQCFAKAQGQALGHEGPWGKSRPCQCRDARSEKCVTCAC